MSTKTKKIKRRLIKIIDTVAAHLVAESLWWIVVAGLPTMVQSLAV
jgi:hypothetical protein